MSASTNGLLEAISHYQRNIERSQNNERGPDIKRLLHCIEKLYKLPINVEHLQETGIGKTINGLRKYDGKVGGSAKALVTKWKTMVATQECEEQISSNNDNNNENNSDEDDFRNDSNFNNIDQNNHISDKNNSNNRDSNNTATNDGTNKSSRPNHSSHKERERKKVNEKYSKKMENNLSSGQDGDFNNDVDEMIVDSDDDEEKLVIVEQSLSSTQIKSSVNKSDQLKSKNSKDETTPRKKNSSSDHHKESLKKSKDHLKYESSSSSKDRKDSSSKHKTSSSSQDKNKVSLSNDEKKSSSNKKHLSNRAALTDKKDKVTTSGNSENGLSNDKKHDRHRIDTSKSRSDSKDKSRDKKSETRHENEKDKSDNDKKYSDSNKKNSHSDKSKLTIHHKSKSEKDISTKRRSSNDDEHLTVKSKTKVPKLLKEVEIDSTTGTSFEEALGMMMPAQKIKQCSKSSPTTIKSSARIINATPSSSSSSNNIVRNSSQISRSSDEHHNDNSQPPPLLTSTAELKPLDLNILSDLGTVSISNNYKPMPLNPTIMDCVFKPVPAVIPRSKLTDDEALQHGISSKTIRTKVYSGIKTGKLFQTLSLFDICIRVLQRNIDCLEYTGGVPFDILKPILERASPVQLSIIEEYNPYLLEDSDCLWEHHVHRCYRGRIREEMESFREMFFRCKEEQESRLDALTKKVKNSQTVVALPVRKTQLAYIDSMVKPPRNVLRKQEQFGTSKKLVATPAARVAALNNVTPNATKIGDARLRVAAHERDTAQAAVHQRPKKAPLMAKSLLLFKGRRR